MEGKQLASRLLVAGVAGLIGLGVVTAWFGPHSVSRIEHKVAGAATRALADGGYAWAKATAHGQKVVLAGVAPSEKARASAVAAVGAANGVTRVSSALGVAPVAAPQPLRARADVPGAAIAGVAPARESVRTISETAKDKRPDCETAFKLVAAENRIAFAAKMARMTRASEDELDKLVEIARSCPEIRIQAQGHTDGTGKRAANLRLSRRRAQAVVDYFEANGIPATRLSAVGYGPDRPIASNRTAQGQAKNRRIEFRVTGGDDD